MLSPTLLRCEQCATEYGTVMPAELDVTNCGKIENKLGRLVCAFRRTTPVSQPKPGSPALPPGNYLSNCAGCKLLENGALLECRSCKRADGSTRYTIIETARCREFTDNDGALACAEADEDDQQPQVDTFDE